MALSDYHPKWKTFLKNVTTELNAVCFDVYSDCCVKFVVRCKKFVAAKRDAGMRRIMTFRSTANRIYDGDSIRL